MFLQKKERNATTRFFESIQATPNAKERTDNSDLSGSVFIELPNNSNRWKTIQLYLLILLCSVFNYLYFFIFFLNEYLLPNIDLNALSVFIDKIFFLLISIWHF